MKIDYSFSVYQKPQHKHPILDNVNICSHCAGFLYCYSPAWKGE